MKKQLVRATLVLEVPVEGNDTILEAAKYLREAVATMCNGGAATVNAGKIELVKVSETGKQSRTKLGDVA